MQEIGAALYQTRPVRLPKLQIELRRPDNTKYFVGRVDEVRVYGRALSEAEIAWLAGHTMPSSIAADLHQDGQIDFRDYAVLADQWLEELLWPQP